MKHLVHEISKVNEDKINIKSVLYGISMDELIMRATDQFIGLVPIMTCPHCHEECRVKEKTVEINVDFAGRSIPIKIEGYPLNICSTCGGEYSNLSVDARLEGILSDGVLPTKRGKHTLREFWEGKSRFSLR